MLTPHQLASLSAAFRWSTPPTPPSFSPPRHGTCVSPGHPLEAIPKHALPTWCDVVSPTIPGCCKRMGLMVRNTFSPWKNGIPWGETLPCKDIPRKLLERRTWKMMMLLNTSPQSDLKSPCFAGYRLIFFSCFHWTSDKKKSGTKSSNKIINWVKF